MCATGVRTRKGLSLDFPVWILLKTYFFFSRLSNQCYEMCDHVSMNFSLRNISIKLDAPLNEKTRATFSSELVLIFFLLLFRCLLPSIPYLSFFLK